MLSNHLKNMELPFNGNALLDVLQEITLFLIKEKMDINQKKEHDYCKTIIYLWESYDLICFSWLFKNIDPIYKALRHQNYDLQQSYKLQIKTSDRLTEIRYQNPFYGLLNNSQDKAKTHFFDKFT